MKTKIFFITLGIFAILGLSLVIYPSILDYINSKNNTAIVKSYSESTQTLSNDEINNELEKARTFNEFLAKSSLTDEEENDYKAVMASYPDILNFDDVICSIEIPKINVNLPIYHGGSEEENDEKLKKGCVHLRNTSLPIGGESTHSVISAHSGYPDQVFFDNLEDLEIGDKFTIHMLDQILTYRVCEINVVDPDDSSKLEIKSGKDYVTLVTCYPYSINTHRLCVRGERIENGNTEVATDDETNDNYSQLSIWFTSRLSSWFAFAIIPGAILTALFKGYSIIKYFKKRSSKS